MLLFMFLILALVVGAVIGSGAMRWHLDGRARRRDTALDQLRQDAVALASDVLTNDAVSTAVDLLHAPDALTLRVRAQQITARDRALTDRKDP